MDSGTNKRKTVIVVVASILAALIVVSIVFGLRQPEDVQRKLLDKQQSQFALTPEADPILAHLPYGSLGYNISPVIGSENGKATLTLSINITLDDSDYSLSSTDLQNTINRREQAALNYIRSLGLDPAKYHIEYSVPSH